MLKFLLLTVTFSTVVTSNRIDANFQHCNVRCGNEHFLASGPPGETIGSQQRGKAGPRGEKGPNGPPGQPGAQGTTGQVGEPGVRGMKGDKGDTESVESLQRQLNEVKEELDEVKEQVKNNFKPTDCQEIKFRRPTSSSAVYKIFPNYLNDYNGVEVYCDMETDGGGWIVFQNRFDGSEDFYRGWDDYVNGFGNLDGGEFWQGLEVTHRLTSGGEFTLRIDLSDFENQTVYALYETFSVGRGKDYILNAAGYTGTSGGSGLMHGQKFSTKDLDQDTWPDNCASTFHAGWWYAKCAYANLNGKYLRGTTSEYGTGMTWYHFHGFYYALKSSKMMFRRKLG